MTARRSGFSASANLEGKVERRLHDLAVDPEGVAPADVVVLHRVVCCYPDYARLLSAAPAVPGACSSSVIRGETPSRAR